MAKKKRILLKGTRCLILLGEVRTKKPSPTLTNGLKVTSEPPPTARRRAACKDKIAQRSAIQAAATLDVA
ncbi:hypothetical protein J6590_062128 [Homalodisca vitripennis]|nr:hypothetical protein J6590_062128 [Homalodisca vitripennis]